MQTKLLVPLVLAFVVVGGGSFFGGIKYQQSKTTSTFAGRFTGGTGIPGVTGGAGAGFQGRRVGGAAGTTAGATAGFITGNVLSKDANSLTIQAREGGSKIVFYASSTRVAKTTDGTLADIASGTPVMVNGTANSDGSVTAQTIQIRPQDMAGIPARP